MIIKRKKAVSLALLLIFSVVAGGCAAQSIHEEETSTELTESTAEVELVTEESTAAIYLETYHYEEMNQLLAAVLTGMDMQEMDAFHIKTSNEQLIQDVLCAYVNLFTRDKKNTVSLEDKAYSEYVKIKVKDAEHFLSHAFGGAINMDSLETDGDRILREGDVYYIAVNSYPEIEVTYSGFDNVAYSEASVYPFDYEMEGKDGSVESGIIQVRFSETNDEKPEICLKSIAVTQY